ncbi:hypothetical protein HpMMM92_08280 [Helicobacter pylori]
MEYPNDFRFHKHTNTQEKAGDTFVKETKGIIDEEWGFGGFVRAYVRVNSVAYSFRGIEVPVEGLEQFGR